MLLTTVVGLCLLGAPEVKFEHPTDEAPLIIVPVKLNGKGPFRFVLDTGASGSVVTPKAAKALGLHGSGTAKAIGAGGSTDVMLTRLDSLELGGEKVTGLTLAIDEMKDVSAVVPNLDGIVGYDFLRRFVLEIDYPASTLRLHAPAPAK